MLREVGVCAERYDVKMVEVGKKGKVGEMEWTKVGEMEWTKVGEMEWTKVGEMECRKMKLCLLELFE